MIAVDYPATSEDEYEGINMFADIHGDDEEGDPMSPGELDAYARRSLYGLILVVAVLLLATLVSDLTY